MQTHGGAPAAAALEATGAERRFAVSLLADWNRNGLYDHPLSDLSRWVEDAQTDPMLSGSSPAELMMVQGESAAELAVTLVGEYEGLNLVNVFSPYNGFSPLYLVDRMGVELIYKIGVHTSTGVVWYQQIVAYTRLVSPQRSAGNVVIRALDRAEKCRQPITLPVWAEGRFMSERGYREAQLCDASWVIDHCLRAADTSSTPWRPLALTEGRGDGVQFWLSGNGSWLPNIGFPDSIRVQGFPKSEATGLDMINAEGTPHPTVAAEAIASGRRPRNLAAMGNDATGYRPAYEPVHPSDGRQQSAFKQYRAAEVENLAQRSCNWFGFTLITRGPNGSFWQSVPTLDVLTIRLGWQMEGVIQIGSSGGVRVTYRNLETAATVSTPWSGIPAGQDSIRIDARLQVAVTSGTSRMHLLVNGADTGPVTTWGVYAGTQPSDLQEGLITLQHKVGVQDVYWAQYSTTFNPITGPITETELQGFVRKPAKYAAVLDRSLNRLTSLPTRSYPDGWRVMTEVAAAELGSVFWDETGIFRFLNRGSLLAKQATIVREYTVRHIQDLGADESLDSVRTIVTADAISAYSDPGIIFEASNPDQFFVAGNSWTQWRLKVDTVSSMLPWQVPRYTSTPDVNVPGLWADTVLHGYVVQFETSPGVWQEQDNLTAGLDINAFFDRDWNLVLDVNNLYSQNARFATDSGSAALRINGTPITRNDSIEVRAQSADAIFKYGPRNLQISGEWVQEQPTAITGLVEHILSRTTTPVATLDDLPVPGDPRIQIGDTVRLRDPDGMGEEMLGQVLGYRRRYSRSGGLHDRLAVELIRPARVGIWDSVQYGRWDKTLIWS